MQSDIKQEAGELINSSGLFDTDAVINSNVRQGKTIFTRYNAGGDVNGSFIRDILNDVNHLLAANPARVAINKPTAGDLNDKAPIYRLRDLTYNCDRYRIPGYDVLKGLLSQVASRVLEREEAERTKK